MKKWFLLSVLMLVMALCIVACTNGQGNDPVTTDDGKATEEPEATITESPTEEESQADVSTESPSTEEATEPHETESKTDRNDPTLESEYPMWNEKKGIVVHLSFDQLWEGTGTSGTDLFTPGQSASWNGTADLSFSTEKGVTFWGWVAVKGEFGVFGYRIDDGDPVFNEEWTFVDEGLTQHYQGAGGDTGNRMRIAIDLSNLVGSHTVDVLYKNGQGEIVSLYKFTAILADMEDVTLPTVEPTVEATLPDAYGKDTADVTYAGDDNSMLYTFENKNAADFEAACKYYTDNGYTVYRATEKVDNRFTTFTKGTAMAHVYWFKELSELNIVISDTAAYYLPPVNPAVTDGDVECTIVQLEDSTHVNGMSYVIQLKDGSYIVYDGSYSSQARLLLQYLKDNHKGEGKPLIRAWVMTHSHNDHYPAFSQIARRWADQIQVEYVLVNPLNEEEFELDEEELYLSTTFREDVARFSGTKLVYVHTGMEFVFCNLTMEVLWTPDDLYKNITNRTLANRDINFNNTSIVTRLYDADYNALFTADIGKRGTDMMVTVYGDYLKSDACQVAHHGVEDVPFSFYDIVRAPLLFYPCDYDLYDNNTRHLTVRLKIEQTDYTKEILIQGLGRYIRAWGTTYAADASLSIPDYTPSTNRSALLEKVGTLTSDKTTYMVGEPIIITASSTEKEVANGVFVGIQTMDRWLNTGLGSDKYWYLKDIGNGMAYDIIANVYPNGLPAGEYILRLVADDSFFRNDELCMAEIIITIIDPNAPDKPETEEPDTPDTSITPTLKSDKTTYTVGEPIIITAWATEEQVDNLVFVGIQKLTTYNEGFGGDKYWYLNQIGNGTAYDIIANVYPNGLPAGEYIVRMITDDSHFHDDARCLGEFIITIVEAEQPDEPDDSIIPSLKSDKTTYTVGEPIIITAWATEEQVDNLVFVGIQKLTTYNEGFGGDKYWYLNQIGNGTAYDIIANVYPNGLPAGEYIVRMITDDSHFHDDARCLGEFIITIVEAEQPDEPDDSIIPSLKSDKTTYTVGEPIIITAWATEEQVENLVFVGIQTMDKWLNSGVGADEYWYLKDIGNGTSYDIIANEYPNGLPAGEYIIRMVTDDSSFRDDELCIGQTIITVVAAE